MKRIAIAAASAVAFLLSTSALAQHAGRGNANGHDDDLQVGTSAGGLRPVTRDEAQMLLQGIARYVDQSDLGLKAVRLPSGAMAIDLDDRFQSATLARVGADGTVVTRCVGSVAEGSQFLATNPAFSSRLVPARRASVVALEEK